MNLKSRRLYNNLSKDKNFSTNNSVEGAKGNWLSILLISAYVASFWLPPPFTTFNFRWFTLLPAAFVAFLAQRQPVSFKQSRIFLIVYGLGLVGALLSLARAYALGQLDTSLQNTFTAFINLVVYLFFLPVITHKNTRSILLILIILLAAVWCIEIQVLLRLNTFLYYSTFSDTGSDKNAIGLLIALANVIMLYIAILWVPTNKFTRNLSIVLRLGFLGISVIMFYSISLIYARSAMLSVGIGLLTIFGILMLKKPNLGGIAIIGIVSVIVFFAISYLWPQVLDFAPAWTRILDSYQSYGLDADFYRTRLIEKGWRIISENPFIGVGIGGTKNFSSVTNPDLPIYLIHNQYLTDWAEKGVFGLISNIFWIWFYFRTVKNSLHTIEVVDLIWLILFPVIFFEMLFLDISSTSTLFLLVLSGITYNRST